MLFCVDIKIAGIQSDEPNIPDTSCFSMLLGLDLTFWARMCLYNNGVCKRISRLCTCDSKRERISLYFRKPVL